MANERSRQKKVLKKRKKRDEKQRATRSARLADPLLAPSSPDEVDIVGEEAPGGKASAPVLNLPDRRLMERTMRDMFGGRHERSPLDEAQDLMYEAWESRDPRTRAALARKAVELSPDCADALTLLAEEAAASPREAIDLYRKSVEAGERAIGKRAFKDHAGHFWGVLETRPYMRARAGLAGALWHVGKADEAADHFRDLLRLNPNDNQGIRYLFLGLLIELGKDDEARGLVAQHPDDPAAVWEFSSALLAFRKDGDTETSRALLQAAFKQNQFVRPYLTGHKRLPVHMPDYVGFGDESEAVSYGIEHGEGWHKTPGALDWLESVET